MGARTVDALWERLLERPYLISRDEPAAFERVAPGSITEVERAADRAEARQVNLLGSGLVELGRPIDWHRDFKTGHRWPLLYGRDLDVARLTEPCDVKVPWELSRFQWTLPLGQSYMLFGNESRALAARQLIEEWISSNPYGMGVNWACTMDVALRAIAWTWLFHALGRSAAWSDPRFRSAFLRILYLHGDFTRRNLEWSDVNGNHYTADAAGLVYCGLFFGDARDPGRWADLGWKILLEELPRQVHADGVDFEGSVAYHRLVTELFLLPSLYRERLGLTVGTDVHRRLTEMSRFSATATRGDETTPLVGDHDDGRVLPLGDQALGDHRYLAGIVAAGWNDPQLRQSFSGPRSEIAWVLGPAAAEALPDRPHAPLDSAAFPDAGFYVMRDDASHVFIDCGPVGLAGRGGHGHSDCLSFEAWLDSSHLISDSGCFVYTAAPMWRNRLRATSAHNTPIIDETEQNRLDPDSLWMLGDDAAPHVRTWRIGDDVELFTGAHDGYLRLESPVVPVRTIALDKGRRLLAVRDAFEGEGSHVVRVPFHLAPEVQITGSAPGCWKLDAGGSSFVLVFDSTAEWEVNMIDSVVAPSYGVIRASRCLEFRRTGRLRELLVVLAPDATPGETLERGRAITQERV